MLTTNHLPPQDKKELRFARWQRITLFFAMHVAAACAIAVVFLSPSFISLWYRRAALLYESDWPNQTIGRFERERALIQQAESLTVSLKTLEASIASPPRAFAWQNIVIPPLQGIAITSFIINKEGEAILRGVAATRHDFLAYEQYVRESGHFKSVFAPLAGIASERNEAFLLNAQVKPEYSL